MKDQPRCVSCVYFDFIKDIDEGTGWCRRYAPRPYGFRDDETLTWPIVDELDWCGELKKKGEPSDPPS